MNDGTLDTSSEKRKVGRPAKRVIIPDSDFEAATPTGAAKIPNDGLDLAALEKVATELVDLDEPTTKQTKVPEGLTMEQLYKMVQDLQAAQGTGAPIDAAWAKASSEGQTHVEVDEATYARLVQSFKEKPTSVWYRNIRFFKKGTMAQIIEAEETSVDYARGMSSQKKAVNRFKGRE